MLKRRTYLIGVMVAVIAPVIIVPLIFSLVNELALLSSILIVFTSFFIACVLWNRADRAGGIMRPVKFYAWIFISYAIIGIITYFLYLYYGNTPYASFFPFLQGALIATFCLIINSHLGKVAKVNGGA